jgi:hypothetical protein
MDIEPPNSHSASPTAAERMRRSRELRRKGKRYVRIRLHKTDIEAFISKGYLEPGLRNDHDALQKAAETIISDALFYWA